MITRVRLTLLGALLLSACTDPTASAAKAEPKPATKTDPAAPQPGQTDPRARTWSFDDAVAGQVPAGFRIAETGGAGTVATWEIVADPSAPTQPHAFGITKTTNGKATYNLALVEGTRYGDVDLTVMVKAGTGQLDRGGGPIWRVTDESNYYIARWNPLENNARFYIVQDGVRTALGKVDLELDVEAWHALRVVAEGPRMELFIDDEPVLTVEDAVLSEPGMIGLWTKADAATLFDDLSVAVP
ncbi:MAG: hypothetical protein AB1Z98_15755 [Nannocystaceae bacterium]